MATPSTKTELIKSQAHELIKQYVALDAYDRPEYIYTAQADATDGAACTRVQYVYASTTSTTVVKMKESYSTWVSATMDI
jgi:hypothetical protein